MASSIPQAAAHTHSDGITIPPQDLTFPEIAQKLTDGEHRVICSKTIANRAAFVSLKNRSWQQCCDLLSAGLDVEFQQSPHEAHLWTMARSPKTARLEAQWRQELLDNLRQQMQDAVGEQQKYSNRSPDAVQTQFEQVQQETERVKKAKRPDEEAQLMALDHQVGIILTAQDMMTFPEYRLGFAWLQTALPELTTSIFDAGWTVGAQEPNSLPPNLLAPVVQKEHEQHPNATYDLFLSGFVLVRGPVSISLKADARLFGLRFSLLMCGPGFSARVPPPYLPGPDALLPEVVYLGAPSRSLVRMSGLDADVGKWLQGERQATTAFLLTRRATAKFARFPDQPVFDSASQYVRSWCETQKAEAVMELYPGTEWLDGPRWQVNEEKLPAPPYTLAGCFLPDGAWTLKEQGRVLLVRNRLAFVDRARNVPAAALIQLLRRHEAERHLANPMLSVSPSDVNTPEVAVKPPPAPPTSGATNLSLFTEESLNEYVLTNGAATAVRWSYPVDSDHYYGFNLEDLDNARAVIYLWQHLPLKERTALLNTKPVGDTTIPLSRFADSDIETAVQIQQTNGLSIEGWQCWHPTYKDMLRACGLRVSWKPSSSKGSVILYLEIDGRPIAPDFPLLGSSSSTFLWTPS